MTEALDHHNKKLKLQGTKRRVFTLVVKITQYTKTSLKRKMFGWTFSIPERVSILTVTLE